MSAGAVVHPSAPCSGCGVLVTALDVFPGGRCLECYAPEGERMMRGMSAERLARMWGGR